MINRTINHTINHNNMARTKIQLRNIRKLLKTMRGSYRLTLPVEFIRELKWKGKQKLVVELDRRRKRIIIKDWPVSKNPRKK